jgi:hypothetical protein
MIPEDSAPPVRKRAVNSVHRVTFFALETFVIGVPILGFTAELTTPGVFRRFFNDNRVSVSYFVAFELLIVWCAIYVYAEPSLTRCALVTLALSFIWLLSPAL